MLAIALAILALTAPTQLHVRQVVPPGSPRPDEGWIPYIRVVRPDGTAVVQRRLNRTKWPLYADVRLSPGRYRLVSWQRICDANCGNLDPPSDRCARWFRIHRGQTLKATITVTFGSGCRIRWG